MADKDTTVLRVDRWLWCARFYKTRSLAAEAVKAGHVRINGQRSKPARELRVGDKLSILRGINEQDVEVRAMPARRGPAPEAAGCYEETADSLERRRLRDEQRLSSEARRAPTAGRPDKRTRRLIRDRQRDRP
jgi:ribosome-associated heat shock protein Hsp15